MNVLNCDLIPTPLILSFLVSFGSVLHAEESIPQGKSTKDRSYAVELSASMSRSWEESALEDVEPQLTDFLGVVASALKVNKNFHFGFSLGFLRSRPSNSEASNTYGLGLYSKTTLFDLRQAMSTPYVTLSATRSLTEADDDSFELGSDGLTLALGYEVFGNEYISLQSEVVFGRSWTEIRNEFSTTQVKVGTQEDDISLRLGLGLYI